MRSYHFRRTSAPPGFSFPGGLPSPFHVLREAASCDESGRGLALIDAITESRWGWHPAPHGQRGKCTWAELRAPLP